MRGGSSWPLYIAPSRWLRTFSIPHAGSFVRPEVSSMPLGISLLLPLPRYYGSPFAPLSGPLWLFHERASCLVRHLPQKKKTKFIEGDVPSSIKPRLPLFRVYLSTRYGPSHGSLFFFPGQSHLPHPAIPGWSLEFL